MNIFINYCKDLYIFSTKDSHFFYYYLRRSYSHEEIIVSIDSTGYVVSNQ